MHLVPSYQRWQQIAGWFLVWLALGGIAGPSHPHVFAAEVTAAEVREAIDRGVQFLRRSLRGHHDGWPEHPSQAGGLPALCALAVLNSGVEPSDPELARAIDRLRRLGNPERTYATSLQTMVFCIAEPGRDRLLIRRNVAWLEEAQFRTGPFAGGWSYSDTKDQGRPDNSNSQFALLALHEAQQIGIPVSPRAWALASKYWLSQQNADGSWEYVQDAPSGSMTCAGIASVLITNNHLSKGDASVLNDQVICCGAQDKDQAAEQGIEWLARNFTVARNPMAKMRGPAPWHHYYLYALERVGRMSGRRFIGRHDWYREGAEFLVRQQDPLDGSWPPLFEQKEISTSMALLFLAKGKRPLLMSKLQFGAAADWNHHRRDIGNLTLHVEQRWKMPMTWQTADLRQSRVEDLLQSPVLFLSGKEGLNLTAGQKRVLYDYVQQGGFLFAEACCGGENFDRDFRQLMSELFPESPLRLLPPDHPIWRAEQNVPAEYLRPLYGIDSCCRTSVVYCPDDLGCYWELARGQAWTYPEAVRREIEAVLGIGTNVVAYATGRELKEKLDVPLVPIAAERSDTVARGSLAVAKLQHSGGSDEAPGALPRLLDVVAKQLQLPVNSRRYLLAATAPELADFPIAFVHGRRAFQWSDDERAALARFVKNGGVIFGDAICGNEAFATSFRQEMAAIFPDAPLRRIPPDHAMFTTEFRGYDLSHVRLNRPQVTTSDEPMTRRTEEITPLLEGIEFDGTYQVIFSPYDLSCALESFGSLECLGYTREDAARIGVNILLYALQQ